MKSDMKKLLKESSELTPRESLAEEILKRAESELAVKTAISSREKPKRPFGSKKWISLTACFAFLVVIFGGFIGVYNESYQTVYIDVNPSVALELNRFEKVNDVEYLNEDAKEALGSLDLRGQSAENALKMLISAYDTAGYFENGAELYISTAQGKNKNSAKLLEKLCDCAEKEKGNKNYSVNKGEFSEEDRASAKEEGISPAKYSLINKIIKENPEYTFDELKSMTMGELKKLQKGKAETGKQN